MRLKDQGDTSSDKSYVEGFRRTLREIVPNETWGIRVEDVWCYAEPPGHGTRLQGWKIHLSATPRLATTVLDRAARILVKHRAAFKFAKGREVLSRLVGMRCERSAGGKFITIYPSDDDQFRLLAEELHLATEGLDGPAILSDRPYLPGSLVHYRYGGFTGDQMVLNVDGAYAAMLVAPDGSWVEDERLAFFSPPAWAPSPLPDTPPRKPESQRGKPVLLADRFAVREAIRHSNRGGVYRATDQTDGSPVVVKQVRPHVGAGSGDDDAGDLIRREADMLDLLEPTGLTPRKISLFEYQGHTFLAEEEINGLSLREWVTEQVRIRDEALPAASDVLDIAQQMVEMISTVHAKGLVLRDFNPANIVLGADGRLRLIDTEFLAKPGEDVISGATMGYASPEQMVETARGPAPEQSADLYSLGASLIYLCSGVHPAMPDGDEPSRRVAEWTAALARTMAADNPLLRSYLPAICGLLANEPTHRWTEPQVMHFLKNLDDHPSAPDLLPARITAAEQDELLRDNLAELVTAMTPDGPYLYPPITWEGRIGDPCSVQSGAAGPVEVLGRAVATDPDEALRDAYQRAVRWLDRHLPKERRVLPGLYFGRSGSAWALYEAAEALDDPDLRTRAIEYAKRIPVRWGNPDFTHGLAGAGMTQLHMWRRTQDEQFRGRTLACAQSLLEACERRDDGVYWPVSKDFKSELAGMSHYGMAHGVAGVANFLIAVAREFDREDLLELGVAAGEVLLAVAKSKGDALLWPTGEKLDGYQDGVAWWCSGSGGVGAFLIRLWRVTGDNRFREYAHGAALAVRKERWRLSAGHCHGVAGNAELLLDLAAATGESRYLDWAAEHAACLYRRAVLRGGRRVISGEGGGVAYSYNLGIAGACGFLHRLRHGGERYWMVDDFALPAPQATVQSAAVVQR